MKIFVNERQVEINPPTTVAELVALFQPAADLFICNGYPVDGNYVVQENDKIVLIKKGQKPTLKELEALITARHTPGIYSKLKAAKVGIAGCGGLGSNVAISLARVGIGTLILVDYDIVEPSNLNRQQFFVEQIGMLKVYALKEIIAKSNPLVKVITIPQKVTSQNVAEIFKDVDIIVEAFDNADQKLMLYEAVQKHFPNKPMVMGLGMAGWGKNNIIKTKKINNLYICGDNISESGPFRGLMAPRVALVANMQANQVLEIILGEDPYISNLINNNI